jgi:hypothetical protein
MLKRTKPAGGGGSGGLHYNVPAREEDLPELSRDMGGGYVRADLMFQIYSFPVHCAVQNDHCCHAKKRGMGRF